MSLSERRWSAVIVTANSLFGQVPPSAVAPSAVAPIVALITEISERTPGVSNLDFRVWGVSAGDEPPEVFGGSGCVADRLGDVHTRGPMSGSEADKA